jgi:Transglutaminase-like superfamily
MAAALRKFLRLNREDRALLVEACALVLVVRIAQWVLPWKSLVGTMRWLPLPKRDRVTFDRLVWAVRSSGARIPRATCLTNALALQRRLHRSGYRANVEIGVAKTAAGRFEFHAWVEHLGEPLLDSADDLARYSRLFTVEAASP